MKNISPLNFVHKVGKFGDYNKKSKNNLLKISEINGLLIFQIAQYKNSNFDISIIKLDGLSFPSSLKSKSFGSPESHKFQLFSRNLVIISLKI